MFAICETALLWEGAGLVRQGAVPFPLTSRGVPMAQPGRQRLHLTTIARSLSLLVLPLWRHAPEPEPVAERSEDWARRSHYGRMERWSFQRNKAKPRRQQQAQRYSRAEDKVRKASVAAQTRLGSAIDINQDELRRRVAHVIEKLGIKMHWPPATKSSPAPLALVSTIDYTTILTGLLDELRPTDKDQFLQEVPAFHKLNPPAQITPDDFAAYYQRWEQLAEQRVLLRSHRIGLGATSVTINCGGEVAHSLDNVTQATQGEGDAILMAALAQCHSLHSVTVRGGLVRNSTLTTLARTLQERLSVLDLNGSFGFDDLGLKAVAAYCPELQVLRLGHSQVVSNEGLAPVVEHCKKLSELVVTDTEDIASALGRVPTTCEVSKVQPKVQSPMRSSVRNSTRGSVARAPKAQGALTPGGAFVQSQTFEDSREERNVSTPCQRTSRLCTPASETCPSPPVWNSTLPGRARPFPGVGSTLASCQL